tara:strand:+ start:5326 stop:7656 length:2331 start_codon:yes stop_codon:yes gene_type:complete
MADFNPAPLIASELGLAVAGVTAVVELLAEGNTVPFIARYRKEATGGLDEVQIRTIEERRLYLLELEGRRDSILAAIEDQGKLTAELRAKIAGAKTKAELEDLYLPYKKKRRTRAMIAKERGLEPLAASILAQPLEGSPMKSAAAFIDAAKEVPDADTALAGARDIVAEIVAEDARVRAFVRKEYSENGMLVSSRARGVGDAPTKFEQYYEFQEKAKTIPSHRFLAIRRGEAEKVLRAKVEVDFDKLGRGIERLMSIVDRSRFRDQLREAVADSCKRLLGPSVESEVRIDLKMRSDLAAIDVFGENLRNLLLAAPLGGKAVIGIDPGLRTGCKCVAVDATGNYLATTTINLVRGDEARAQKDLLALIKKHPPSVIAVGNGTGGRETETFARALCKKEGLNDVMVVSVNEAGASIYSASDIAREEFPDLDLTLRGAISIARRLQDPLAELVKIEPKAIGVGQYQHDVNQPLLQRKLEEVIESCVNHVGVALNTASASLLSFVAGIGAKMAARIVEHRAKNGAFVSRKELLKVAGLGPKAFEQAAGFLRIAGSKNPLDASAVHPESYALVMSMAKDLGVEVSELVGNADLAQRLELSRYEGVGVGALTLRDIASELAKPGRDPRDAFEPPKFRDDVQEMSDLRVGMSLEGVVTNVTAFGAFVDVGVHQDGLVHVSKLSDRFVKDPSEIVRVGDKLRVHVMEVDITRKRISLSAKSEDAAGATQPTSKEAPKKKQDSKTPDRGGKRSGANRPASSGKRNGGNGQPTGGFANNPFAKLKS